MTAILFLVMVHTHWFGADTYTVTTQEFNTLGRCEHVMSELNRESAIHNANIHAKCVIK